LGVKGVDMVQFGPADYAMSVGLTGKWTHPDVVRAERRTIETALKRGIHPRVELGDPADAPRYLEMGVRHFCIGWDVTILHRWWAENGKRMRGLLAGERRRAAKATTRPSKKQAKPKRRRAARHNYRCPRLRRPAGRARYWDHVRPLRHHLAGRGAARAVRLRWPAAQTRAALERRADA